MSWNQRPQCDPPPVCFNCEQPGHYVINCPRPSRLNPGAIPAPLQQQQPQVQYQQSQYGQHAPVHTSFQQSQQYQQSAQPSVQSYQSYVPPPPAPYITPQYTGNLPQPQGYPTPQPLYGQSASQITPHPYQHPSYPQPSPSYGHAQPQAIYGQPPPHHGQLPHPPNYVQPGYNQYQQPQPQQYQIPQQSGIAHNYVQTPVYNAPPPPQQAWQTGMPAQMSASQSFPPPQFQGSPSNNQSFVGATNFTQPFMKQQNHQKQRNQSFKQYEKNSKKHRNSRKATTNSGFASHPSESFAVDVPRDVNMASGSTGSRSRSQSLANLGQSHQSVEESSSQLPPSSMDVEVTTEEEDEDFHHMSEHAFRDLQNTSPASRLANPLSTNPNDDPVFQEDYNGQSSVSRFATEHNKKEFILSVKDSHRWSSLKHDPAFKEFVARHDNIPLHLAKEWWSKKEGILEPQRVIVRSRKRSRSADVAVYEGEGELPESTTLPHESDGKQRKNKTKKLRLGDFSEGLSEDDLSASQSASAARERTPCIQVATDDTWGPEPGEIGMPSSPPDPTVALLATFERIGQQHASVLVESQPNPIALEIIQPPPALSTPPVDAQQQASVPQPARIDVKVAGRGQHQPAASEWVSSPAHVQTMQTYSQTSDAPKSHLYNHVAFGSNSQAQSAYAYGNQHAYGRSDHQHISTAPHVQYQYESQWHDSTNQVNTGYLDHHSHLLQSNASYHNHPIASATNLYNNCNFDQRQSSHAHSGRFAHFGRSAPPPPSQPPSHIPNHNGNNVGGGDGPFRQDSGYASERGSWGVDSVPQSASTAQPSPLSIDTSKRPGTASSDEELSPTSKAVLGLGEDDDFLGKWDPRKPEKSRHRRSKRPPPVVDEAYSRRW